MEKAQAPFSPLRARQFNDGQADVREVTSASGAPRSTLFDIIAVCGFLKV
jgi:hypothetical protein